MENLIGRTAKLPDGQQVVIEDIEGTMAVTRRIEGEFKGRIGVCSLSSLELGT